MLVPVIFPLWSPGLTVEGVCGFDYLSSFLDGEVSRNSPLFDFMKIDSYDSFVVCQLATMCLFAPLAIRLSSFVLTSLK